MADNLMTAGKLAKAWDVPQKKIKEAIEQAGIEADVVKGNCKYYSEETSKQIKAALQS